MAASKIFGRPIRLRKDEELENDTNLSTDQESQDEPSDNDSEGNSDGSDPGDGESSEAESGHDDQLEGDEEGEEAEEGEEGLPSESLRDISFGALAKAQASLGPPARKRKAFNASDQGHQDPNKSDITSQTTHAESQQPPTKRPRFETTSSLPARTTKHAPTIQSSKYAVTRRREIFSPSASSKFRDPRFDPTVLSSTNTTASRDKANKNYSFLTDYQAQEVLDLKTKIKKSKDPQEIAELKRTVMSIEAKLRSAEDNRRQKEILRRHNEKERVEIRSGKKEKPYFLKAGEVKKMANQERVEGMGKKAREKSEKRKRKREKGKEARLMPRVRRER